MSGENSNESPDFVGENEQVDYLTDLEIYKQQSEELTNKLEEAN